jgi:hypothetical protein
LIKQFAAVAVAEKDNESVAVESFITDTPRRFALAASIAVLAVALATLVVVGVLTIAGSLPLI